MNTLYTTEGLAELLAVSPRTIRREREDGKLLWVQIRGQIRYRQRDVIDYLDRSSSPARSSDRRSQEGKDAG